MLKGHCFGIIILIVMSSMQLICAAQEDGTYFREFVVTAYNIANEADHPCQDTDKILAKGLNNYYCLEFLADIIMQGSGVDNNNNNFIQIDWSGGKKPTTPSNTFFTYVQYITTASGNRLEDGVSIAVDPSIIPYNSWVYIENIGWRRADDTGKAITGKRIDVFMNVPRQVAMDFGVKNLDVLIPAALNGHWEGTYYYSDGRAPVKFSASMTFSANRFYGKTQEPNTFSSSNVLFLFANIDGSMTRDIIAFDKTYDGTGNVIHTINYSGMLDVSARKISGTWSIPGTSATGTFEMNLYN